MLTKILGSAAGGGYPQWNCNCPTCAAARADHTPSRLQSSVAIRGEVGSWFILNASPDLRQQVEMLAFDRTPLRTTPFAGVLLTDGEIDHTTGLLLVRESHEPLRVWSSVAVRAALTTHYPVFPVVERYCGLDWAPLEHGVPVELPGSSLTVEPFPTGGDAPLYMGDVEGGPEAFGLAFHDRANGSTMTYAPALAHFDEAVLSHLRRRDLLLIDGTFWQEDELTSLGISERGASAMGHVPLSGRAGSLDVISALGGRKVVVHINNTNPILLPGSEARRALDEAGIEVGHDGMEISLR